MFFSFSAKSKECRASGSPPPEIIWVRSDGTAVGDVPGLRQVLSNGNLVFPPFQAEDYRQEVHAQVYACLAKNQFGSIISRDVNVRAGKKHFSFFSFNFVRHFNVSAHHIDIQFSHTIRFDCIVAFGSIVVCIGCIYVSGYSLHYQRWYTEATERTKKNHNLP